MSAAHIGPTRAHLAPGEPSEAQLRRDFESWIAGPAFSCLAARAALRRGDIETRTYPALGEPRSTAALHADLVRFAGTVLGPDRDFGTMAAIFRAPAPATEAEFEAALWHQLQLLHDRDAVDHAPAPGYPLDPRSPDFAFSVAGHPFFVAGLNPAASRISRRFSRAVLVFNSHHQFDRLKRTGVYQGLQGRIRARELGLQGSVNPMLTDHGESSEAVQYSGRATETGWVCPFSGHAP